MSAELELERLRQAFAIERSELENKLAELRRRCENQERALERRDELLTAIREQRPAERLPSSVPPDPAFRVPIERFRSGIIPWPPEGRYGPEGLIVRCANCDSQVGQRNWERNGLQRCEACGPWPLESTACPTCGSALTVGDDGCAWCGAGAHSP